MDTYTQMNQKAVPDNPVVDSNFFNSVYISTDISNPDARKAAIEFIRQKGSTADTDAYITALEACNDNSIKKALQYQHASIKTFKNFSWIFVVLGVLLLILGQGFLLSVCVCGIGVAIDLYVRSLKDAWNTLTLNGTVVHPAVTLPQSTSFSNLFLPRKAEMTDKKAFLLSYIHVVAIVLLIVVVLFSSGSGRSADKTFQEYISAYENRDAKKIVSLMPNAYIRELKTQGLIESKEEYTQRIQKFVDWRMDMLEAGTSENYRYEAIIWHESMPEKETLPFVYVQNEYGDSGNKIKKLKEIAFHHTAYARDGSGEKYQIYDDVRLIKIGRSWYVAAFDSLYLD